MKKSSLLTLAAVFVLAVAAGFFMFRTHGGQRDGVELDWRQLGELDYITGKAPAELAILDGKEVKIPGFMVPLEDNVKAVTTFLLVPSPQACIHVPPPPPNQMVLVEMDADSQAKVEFGPIWIYGKLNLKPKKHMYGESSFSMQGRTIEPYR